MTPISGLIAAIKDREPDPVPPPPRWFTALFWLGVVIGAAGAWWWSR